ncbi:hypothetical protein UFOVP250_78 [uncultured Caudovirales phage]|uniref:Uncharacterized protein n=1 Tax=uncultured Caudovirales phage TaxID=2100421 RepID=A0A6J5LJT4_9CAUD|nr:hypothetical protein UFOVP250_78 [uncultured Caudovirales phage]
MVKVILLVYGIATTLFGLLTKDINYVIIGNIWMVGSLVKE